MSVGLVIVTHERIASAIVETAIKLLGACPLPLKIVPVPHDCDPEQLRAQVGETIRSVEEGEGVLVLTDIYGSTPSNVAGSLIDDIHVKMVSGVNLPMLVRILNYPRLGLEALAEKAVSGGRDGVMFCRRE